MLTFAGVTQSHTDTTMTFGNSSLRHYINDRDGPVEEEHFEQTAVSVQWELIPFAAL